MEEKKRFWCLLGLRPKGTAARHPCVIVRKVIAPHTCAKVCLPMNRQHPFARCQAATYFFKREKVGKKRFCLACVLAASEIACRQFRRRGSACAKSPGWPASDFRARSQRDIYGTFCPGPICPGKAGRRRECYRSTGSARPKQAAGKRRTAGVNGPAT